MNKNEFKLAALRARQEDLKTEVESLRGIIKHYQRLITEKLIDERFENKDFLWTELDELLINRKEALYKLKDLEYNLENTEGMIAQLQCAMKSENTEQHDTNT